MALEITVNTDTRTILSTSHSEGGVEPAVELIRHLRENWRLEPTWRRFNFPITFVHDREGGKGVLHARGGWKVVLNGQELDQTT